MCAYICKYNSYACMQAISEEYSHPHAVKVCKATDPLLIGAVSCIYGHLMPLMFSREHKHKVLRFQILHLVGWEIRAVEEDSLRMK